MKRFPNSKGQSNSIMKAAMQHFKIALIISCTCVALLAVSACGTPAVAVNPYNPGAPIAVAGATTPTSTPIANAPTMESMPGMTNPTNAPVATAAGTVTPGPSPTELVIDWLLYGSPTATVNGVAQSPQISSLQAPVTPTPNTRAQGTTPPTTGNAQTAAPTATPVPATAAQPPAVTVPATAAATTAPTTANAGDPARGQALFQGVALCSSCHDVANGVTIVGPSLKGVASRAGSREPGKSAADYIHESIVSPNAFIVPGFSGYIMPQTFAQTLTPQQIDDLVAYLLTLK
jgi:cytochrome c2